MLAAIRSSYHGYGDSCRELFKLALPRRLGKHGRLGPRCSPGGVCPPGAHPKNAPPLNVRNRSYVSCHTAARSWDRTGYSTSLATRIPSFCKLQRSDDWRGENTAGLSEESTCLRVTSTRSLSRSAKPRDRCGRTNKLLTIRSGLSQPSFATLPLARGSIPRSLSIVRGSELLALECAMTLIVLITIGFITCGFLLYVLVQWMRDGSRKSAGSPSTTEVTHADTQKRQRLVIAFRRNEKRKSQRVSKPTGAYRGTGQKASLCFMAPRENRTGAAFGMTGMRRTKWST